MRHVVPSSLKWKSKNICCIYTNTNPIVFCFCSTRGRWDIVDVEETYHMLPVLRMILLLFSCARLCDCATSTLPREFLSGITSAFPIGECKQMFHYLWISFCIVWLLYLDLGNAGSAQRSLYAPGKTPNFSIGKVDYEQIRGENP